MTGIQPFSLVIGANRMIAPITSKPFLEMTSFLFLALACCIPQFLELALHESVQLVCELDRYTEYLYKFLHVGEVFEPSRICHAGRELHLNQIGEFDIADSIGFEAYQLRVGERNRLGFAVPWIFTCCKELDLYTELSVTQVFAIRKWWEISRDLPAFRE